MAKKENRISVNAFEKVANENFSNTVTKEWFGVEVSIRRTLPLREALMFTEDIVNACFAADGAFIPQVMDFAIKDGILTRYANFTMPSNTEKQYELIYTTGAADMVLEEIDREQLDSIIDAADRKIDYLCDANIKEVRTKLEDVLMAFEEMGNSFEKMFDGVTSEDIKNMVSAIGDIGNLDESKIVEAYMKQRDAESHGEDAAPTGAESGEE